jgi:polyhydroxyalkanoate synthesis regulator phasin
MKGVSMELNRKVVSILAGVIIGLTPLWAIGGITALSDTQKASYLKDIEQAGKSVDTLCQKGELKPEQCKEMKSDLESLQKNIASGNLSVAKEKKYSSWWCKFPLLQKICQLLHDLGAIAP